MSLYLALGAGGVAVIASGRRELMKRWLVWAVSAPLVTVSLAFGARGAAALAAGVGVVVAFEWARLAGLTAVDRLLLQGLSVALPVLAAVEPSWFWRSLLLLPVVGLLPSLRGEDGRRALHLAYGALWSASLSGLVLLGHHALAVCVAVSVADVAAWCAGNALHGPRLTPLSPNKTIAGVLGGAVAATVVLLVFGQLTVPLAIACLLGGVLGDLLESAHKRTARVKDAGAWLPGFGGLLDRVDSLLVALAVAAVLS